MGAGEVKAPAGFEVLRAYEERSLMDPEWAAPPAAQTCLVSNDASRVRKGGTFIDERVLELSVHETMMKNPASYRPAECRCGCRRLHLHDRKERKPRGAGGAVVTVVIFLCAECSASWRVLPAFLARCLWSTWKVIEATLFEDEESREVAVPVRSNLDVLTYAGNSWGNADGIVLPEDVKAVR